MDFPKIEFYVAYNGTRTLKDDEKNLVVDLGDIVVTATVVDIRFDSLPKEKSEDTQDALAGYAYFAKVFAEMKARGKTPYQAYRIAVEKSLEEGYLADIWRRKECVDMFESTYCYDDHLREGSRAEGREEGRKEGLVEGRSEGLQLGPQIYNALRKSIPLSTIAKNYGITIREVEEMKEAFSV